MAPRWALIVQAVGVAQHERHPADFVARFRAASSSAARKRSFSGACRSHAQVPLRAERLPAAHDHAALREAAARSPPRRGRRARPRRSSPGCRSSRGRARSSSASTCRRSIAVRSTRVLDLVLVLQRLGRRGQRQGVDAERLAHDVDGAAEVVGAGERVAHAQPAQAVDLRERAQQHEVRVLLEQRRASRRGPGASRTRCRPRRGSPPRGAAARPRTRRSRRSAAPWRSGCSGCRRPPCAWRRDLARHRVEVVPVRRRRAGP